MPITFHPDQGSILRCDFSKGFVPPEMVKQRLVVVVSPRARVGAGLCTVVPISTTAPNNPREWHVCLSAESTPPAFRNGDAHWVKCDMLYTVSTSRLDRLHHKPFGGKRVYLIHSVDPEDWILVQKGVAAALGLP